MQLTYLDNNATTRIDPRVVDAMTPYLTQWYGNPSSVHAFGARVAADIEQARGQVAACIGARESEIVFTSGGTEADNAALRGVAAARPRKRHIVISAVEHHAILETAERMEQEGWEVTQIGVDAAGRLDLDGLAAALRDDTLLVSVMLVNNETGVVFPLDEVCRIAHERNVLVHTDAVNAIGKTNCDVAQLGVDLLSLSAHKIHGPKGVGALYIRRGTPFRSLIVGGPQERHRRGGTHNAAGIIALGKACELVSHEPPDTLTRIATLRDRLEREVTERFANAHVIGRDAERVANTSCICFSGVTAEAVLMLLSEADVCVSSGAACSSGSLEPSHVLRAMHVDPAVAQGQIRFSLSRFSTDEDIDRLLDVLPGVLERVAVANA
ncbi:MAG: aminotransferase class V-fold PLP-dependent enzyme [Planctomycetota bacterium]|nr:MAG: aminotransferase class V-fold PLP-dependent enzyme [Planctomycetota bacterium]